MLAAKIAEVFKAELVQLFEGDIVTVKGLLVVFGLERVCVPELEREVGGSLCEVDPPYLHIISLEVLLKMET